MQYIKFIDKMSEPVDRSKIEPIKNKGRLPEGGLWVSRMNSKKNIKWMTRSMPDLFYKEKAIVTVPKNTRILILNSEKSITDFFNKYGNVQQRGENVIPSVIDYKKVSNNFDIIEYRYDDCDKLFYAFGISFDCACILNKDIIKRIDNPKTLTLPKPLQQKNDHQKPPVQIIVKEEQRGKGLKEINRIKGIKKVKDVKEIKNVKDVREVKRIKETKEINGSKLQADKQKQDINSLKKIVQKKLPFLEIRDEIIKHPKYIKDLEIDPESGKWEFRNHKGIILKQPENGKFQIIFYGHDIRKIEKQIDVDPDEHILERFIKVMVKAEVIKENEIVFPEPAKHEPQKAPAVDHDIKEPQKALSHTNFTKEHDIEERDNTSTDIREEKIIDETVETLVHEIEELANNLDIITEQFNKEIEDPEINHDLDLFNNSYNEYKAKEKEAIEECISNTKDNVAALDKKKKKRIEERVRVVFKEKAYKTLVDKVLEKVFGIAPEKEKYFERY